MLQSDLLRTTVSKGRVRPLYAEPDGEVADMAKRMIVTYAGAVGKKKLVLAQELQRLEEEYSDYKLVRGLSALLERRSAFEVQSPIQPRAARALVFSEASRRKAVGKEDVEQVLKDSAAQLSVTPQDVERSLWSDLDDELVLKEFQDTEPAALIRQYNLSLAQTLLFKCSRIEFRASGNWKNIFKEVKRLGLIYTVEKDDAGYSVAIEGPVSLFKFTDRYGTSLAKLLPHIARSAEWSLKAEVVDRKKGRVRPFEESGSNVKGLFPVREEGGWGETEYDSSVEARFATTFESLRTGWTLSREPEPLVAGTHVMIPDFGFERSGVKVYLEIVGFWTSDYLERKLKKLALLPPGIDIMVAADESLACSRLERTMTARSRKAAAGGDEEKNLLYYRNSVPMKPILDRLKKREAAINELDQQALTGKLDQIKLLGEVVSIDEIAKSHNVSSAAARNVLDGTSFDGYRRIGDSFVAEHLIQRLEARLKEAEGSTLTLAEASKMIEAHGLADVTKILDALGYAVKWNGLDYEKSTVTRRSSDKKDG